MLEAVPACDAMVADATVPVTRDPAMEDAVLAWLAITALDDMVADADLPDIVFVTVRLVNVPTLVNDDVTTFDARVVPVKREAFMAEAVFA
jgi:hypothetical protein